VLSTKLLWTTQTLKDDNDEDEPNIGFSFHKNWNKNFYPTKNTNHGRDKF